MSLGLKTTLSTIVGLALGLGLSMSAPTSAHASAFSDADKAVEYRQQSLQLIRENFAYMAGMVRGEIDYDGEMFEQRAIALQHLSHVPWDGFRNAGENHRGSGDALPAVWENWSDFESRSEQLQEDAKALAEAAASHELSDVRNQFMATARNCQQCHERYRD